MKKQITALLASCACMMQLSSFAASANTPIVTVSPGNMVFLDVVDPDGNSVDYAKVHLYDAAGTHVGWLLNDRCFINASNSGIVATEPGKTHTYGVPWNYFTPYAAPETLFQIDASDTADMGIRSIYTAGEEVYISQNTPRYLNLYSHSATETTALTIEANQFAVYVDSRWANRTVTGYVSTPTMTFNFNTAQPSMTTIPTGSVRVYQAETAQYPAEIGLESYGGITASPVILSNTATEYVLCRLPLHQLDPYRFDTSGNYTYEGMVFDLRQDTASTHALLVIQSGAVLSAVIPDADGYVEFYLDRATRTYSLDYSYHFQISGTTGCSGFSASGTGGTLTQLFAEPAFIPEDEVILTQVPAGTYTLTYENLPEGYEAPKTTTLTVTDSQEVQYLQLMLEKAALLGDVDENGTVNAADAALLLKAASLAGSGGASGLNADQEQSSDVNGDGVYNASDAALILQYAAYAGSGGTMTIEAYLAERTVS